MKNSEESNNDFKLRKNEILRGYNSFHKVLQNSRIFSTQYLKAFVNKQSAETKTTGFSKSPLFTEKVKVGFIIAKKKFKKAVRRNRIRRLLKEAYRLSKNKTGLINLDLNIIFTLSDNGYILFKNNSEIKLDLIKNEMILLTSKIKLKYSSL